MKRVIWVLALKACQEIEHYGTPMWSPATCKISIQSLSNLSLLMIGTCGIQLRWEHYNSMHSHANGHFGLHNEYSKAWQSESAQ
jgi:hypothetical protein